jgi:hypothetical protein
MNYVIKSVALGSAIRACEDLISQGRQCYLKLFTSFGEIHYYGNSKVEGFQEDIRAMFYSDSSQDKKCNWDSFYLCNCFLVDANGEEAKLNPMCIGFQNVLGFTLVEK